VKIVTRLHAGNSRAYHARPLEKQAVLQWEPATYRLEWGNQTFDGPHIRVKDAGGDYGVDLGVFFTTHQPIGARPDHYMKSVTVRAVQVDEDTEIHTKVGARTEATAIAKPGGWIIQNPTGELYYNTAEEFTKRYEPDPAPAPLKQNRGGAAPTLEDHLFGPGPKRILALDGGGIRGRISLGILEKIESIVGAPLSSYFDLIGGTSTGSIIATGLAMGWSVQKLIGLYDALGTEVFKTNMFRLGLWRAKFPVGPLESALKQHFGDYRLGDDALKTGLVIVTKRLDTNSPWPLHNNPRGKYYGDPPPGGTHIPNRKYLLRQLVRASSAAPHFFDAERIAVTTGEEGAFVDGGVSPYNNPALALVLIATLKGYGFSWPLGVDRLQVVSVGTGGWRVKHPVDDILRKSAAENAITSLLSLMDDCSSLNELLMQWLSESATAHPIDSEVGDLYGDLLGGKDPWLTYLRYNAPLELDWLKSRLPEEHFDEASLTALRRMDNPKSLDLLMQIGKAAAESVRPEHFPGCFT